MYKSGYSMLPNKNKAQCKLAILGFSHPAREGFLLKHNAQGYLTPAG
jgi:hypothetical protein